MIFGTYELHKATSGKIQILSYWRRKTMEGATCINTSNSGWQLCCTPKIVQHNVCNDNDFTGKAVNVFNVTALLIHDTLQRRFHYYASASRTKKPRKPKIGTMETRHTRNSWTYLEVRRSNVKVTRPINAHTVNAQYLPNGKVYELQIWCTDESRTLASATIAVTSKVKGQGRKVTWRVWQVLAFKSWIKCPRNTKIGIKVAHLRTRFEIKRSKIKVFTGPIYAETESVSATNFKLGKRLMHALSIIAMSSYIGLWSWVIARGRGIPCRPHPAAAT